MTTLSPTFFVFYCFLHIALAATNGLVLPNPLDDCACPDTTLNYTCNVVGGAVTLWSGSEFDCPATTNQIALLHSQFGMIAPVACGALSAVGVSVTNTSDQLCYSSVLTIPVSTSLNGLTVGCSRDSVSSMVPGSPHTLSVAGAAPRMLNVSSIGRSTFTLSWTPAAICSSVESYRVNFTCGNCTHNAGTNKATCSVRTLNDWQTCSVSVTPLVCGGMTGETSESLSLLLQVPGSVMVSIEPRYSQSSGTLTSLSYSFSTVPPVPVVSGLTLSVSYFIQFNGETRELTEGDCTGGVCTGRFNISSSSVQSSDFVVTTSNDLGNGEGFSQTILRSVNSVTSLTVRVVESSATFTLNLLGDFVGTTNVSVEYSRAGGVVMSAVNSSTASAGGTLTVTLTSLQVGVTYSYTVSLTLNGLELTIQGEFRSQCLPEDLGSPVNSTNPICIMGNFTGGVRVLNGDVCYTGTLPGQGSAQLFCDDGFDIQPGSAPMFMCQTDGTWSDSTAWCVQQVNNLWWQILLAVLGAAAGCGVVGGGGYGGYKWYQYAQKKKACGSKSGSGSADERGLTKSSPPPPDSLCADPNTIEHQTTPGGEEYAMVAVKGKKKKKPTQDAALCQDPNAIKHTTAPSGETYAVVDKPKRESSKKEPDVVPPQGAEGTHTQLTYADIDVSNARRNPKPVPQRQAQDPGQVEYADVARM